MTEASSTAWEGAAVPRVSVLIATYQRSRYLADLVSALEAQDVPLSDFEVVLVDNGSTDDTWSVLLDLVRRTSLRLRALRLPANLGPGGARNHAARVARAEILAVTDDDCLPTPGWVGAVVETMSSENVVVMQGRVEPPPAQRAVAAPWDHTIWVTRPSPFFETCNVAYRREDFVAVGGFDEHDPLFRPRTGRAFGEDAVLAWQILRRGGSAAFDGTAVVHHRVVPGTFRGQVRDVRHAAGFPGLARRSPLVARWLQAGIFLSRDSFAFDLGVAGLVAATVTRRPWLLAAAGPWMWRRGRRAFRQAHRDPVRATMVLGQRAVVDATIFASLVEGSVRHRRLVL